MARLTTKIAEYAIIINEDTDEFLLVQWGEQYQFKWHFVGGRLDEGEREIEGLKREVQEELNIEIEDIKPVFTRFIEAGEFPDVKDSRYAVFYLAKIKDGHAIKVNKNELHDAGWFKRQDLANIDFWFPFYKEMLADVLPF